MLIENRVPVRCAVWLALVVLGGCSSHSVELDSVEHRTTLASDRRQAEQRQASEVITLSLEEAIKRGIESNLDARVAAIEILIGQKNVTLEQLKMLPAVNASAGYNWRSNDAASSSRSVESGLESLEPSQSSDRDRKNAALEVSWNLLDVALSYADAKKADEEAKVALERHEKVIQNIERDVYAAYWRAYSYQTTKGRTDELIAATDAQIDKINKAVREKLLSADAAGDQVAQLNDRVRSLRELNDRLNLSEIELKSMLSLPLDSTLVLKKPMDRMGDYKSLLRESVENQEWEALQNRPEVREEILQKNITLRDTKREILSTFPGIELFAGANYDSNSFLSDATWYSSSAKVVQSLISIFTLPARHQAAKNKEALADARRQALVAAVLAQTNIARQRLKTQDANYQTSLRSLKAAQNKANLIGHKTEAGFSSGQAALTGRLEAQVETMRNELARADLQDSYAAYMNTLGRRFFRPVNLAQALGGAE